jgi:hypothetical protein
MKTVICRIWITIIVILVFNSCITNKLVIENDLNNPTESIAKIFKQIEVGDVISLKVNNRTYKYLRVVNMDGPQMKVKQYHPDYGSIYHTVNLEYIQELKRVETEARYPVGVPVTILIVLFYLLV